MTGYYELKIAGLRRKLPFIQISKNTKIASFNILGDVELVEKVSDILLAKLKNYKFDYFVGPEVKVVPLIQVLSRKMKIKRYVVCRKSVKPHMISPVILKPLSYFPKHVRPLVIDGADRELLKGKKVIIIDDVISTGVTVRMMKHLMEKIGAEVVAVVGVIKQGEVQFDEIENFFYLAKLPIIKTVK